MKQYLKGALLALTVACIGIAFAGRDGSGTYSLPAGNPVSTGTTISSTWANTTLTDIATALSNSIAKDGQTVATANLPMGTFKHTNVGNASARNHYAAAGQVQDFSLQTLGSVAGTNTITGNLNPAITAYVDGMIVGFRPSANNTGATTLAINGLTAQAVVKFSNSALVSGDLSSGDPAFLLYASNGGGRFILLNPQSANLINGVAISDLARLSVANSFTVTPQRIIGSTAGEIRLVDNGAATHKTTFGISSDDGSLLIVSRDEDGTFLETAATFTKAADGTISAATIAADTVNLNGSTAVQVNGNAIIGPLAAGTYSPTVTNVTNVTGSSAGTHNYMRVGNTVTVSGNVACNSSASGLVDIAVSLPVASNFTTLSDANGAGGSVLGTGILRGIAAALSSDATNDRVDIVSTATAAGTCGFFYSFTYVVK